jgi:hypothetical protein
MDADTAQFELDSKTVGALPIINRVIARIGLPDILTAALPSRPSQKLSHVDASSASPSTDFMNGRLPLNQTSWDSPPLPPPFSTTIG